METNESILAKGVVSLDDRKLMGQVKSVVIDCNTGSVSHYIVVSASTNTSLVLPLRKTLGIGDTFMTIQGRADFLPTTDFATISALDDNFNLVGMKVYAQTGNYLGVVKGFELETTFGKVTKIDLENGVSFDLSNLLFFSSEYVFVNDGSALDIEVRALGESNFVPEQRVPVKQAETPEAKKAVTEAKAASPVVAAPAVASVEHNDSVNQADRITAPIDQLEILIEEEFTEVDARNEGDKLEESIAAVSDDIFSEFKTFLLGKVLNERVASDDGSYVVEAGTELTEAVIEEAKKHDVLLPLMMSVDE